MTKPQLKKAINKIYSDHIAYKNLPKPYQFGMKNFKEEVVNFIASNFHVSGSKCRYHGAVNYTNTKGVVMCGHCEKRV